MLFCWLLVFVGSVESVWLCLDQFGSLWIGLDLLALVWIGSVWNIAIKSVWLVLLLLIYLYWTRGICDLVKPLRITLGLIRLHCVLDQGAQ